MFCKLGVIYLLTLCVVLSPNLIFLFFLVSPADPLQKNYFQNNTFEVLNSFDPDHAQGSKGPGVGPICFKR